MEEFQHFDLGSAPDLIIEKKENKFNSSLGDFSHFQDRILRFGKSKNMIVLAVLLYLGLIADLISSGIVLSTDLTFSSILGTYSLNWMKIIVVLGMGVSLLIPIGVTRIIIGSKHSSIYEVIKGLELVQLLVSITYVLLIIGAIAGGLLILSMLFSAFIAVVIYGGILFGVFYFFFKFLKRAKSLLDDIMYNFSSGKQDIKIYPSATDLKTFFVVILVISVIAWIINLFDAESVAITSSLSFLNTINSLDIISFIIQTITLIYVISQMDRFDEFIRIGKPTFINPSPSSNVTENYHPVLRNQNDDDNWRVKF